MQDSWMTPLGRIVRYWVVESLKLYLWLALIWFIRSSLEGVLWYLGFNGLSLSWIPWSKWKAFKPEEDYSLKGGIVDFDNVLQIDLGWSR